MQTIFLDLKSAFDIANREIILEQLTSLGIQGKLTWTQMYLSKQSARVLYRGIKSTHTKGFELGTPQGGVLSPMLFNILMHRLLGNIPLEGNDSIICYAGDICIKSLSEERMQEILDILSTRATECGLIISTEKTKALNPKTILLPRLHINDIELDLCHQCKYLGVIVNDAEFIRSRKKRQWGRLKPLRTLVGKNH